MIDYPNLGQVVERMKNECADPSKINLLTLKNCLFYLKQHYPLSLKVLELEMISNCILEDIMAVIKIFETDKKEILRETIKLTNELKRKVEELRNAIY